MNEAQASGPIFRKHIQIRGVVQGVGFRPFVYRIAQQCGVRGRVLNSSDGVIIEAEAGDSGMARFLSLLTGHLPPLARIDDIAVSDEAPAGDADFRIEHSVSLSGRFVLVPPDIATCEDCTRDFTSPDNR